MIEKPEFFIKNDISKKKLNYSWNKAIKYHLLEERNPILMKQLLKLNFKATMGFATAAAEWITWRLENFRYQFHNKNMNEERFYIEAQYIGLIDKHYIWNLDTEEDLPDEDKIETPIYQLDRFSLFVRDWYITTRFGLHHRTCNILMLARHVTEQDKLFDDWLVNRLKLAISLFPNKSVDSENKPIEGYDSSQDPFIPREFFFDMEFDYGKANLLQMQKNLLLHVNNGKNRYLAPPNEMIKEGFLGIPYQIEGV